MINTLLQQPKSSYWWGIPEFLLLTGTFTDLLNLHIQVITQPHDIDLELT